MVKKRSKKWYIYFYPFGAELVGLSVDVKSKTEAKEIEAIIKQSCRAWSFDNLDTRCREAIRRMFDNREWELPSVLSSDPVPAPVVQPKPRMTLWKGIELCLKYPDFSKDNKERTRIAFSHIVAHFGKDYPLDELWIPQIKEYLMLRREEAAASSINKEKSALSNMFRVLIELKYFENNPCRQIKNLSEKANQRRAYISYQDFTAIVERLPEWMVPVVKASFYSGMRRGELMELERKRINLKSRIIQIGPADTKECEFKEVPIHRDLVPVLHDALKVRNFENDLVFLNKGRAFSEHSLRKPWTKAVSELGLDPMPTFHDLRHSFIANCRRSGVFPEFIDAIVGHWGKEKAVNQRYGYMDQKELIEAIDKVSWDNGDTRIYVSSKVR